MNLLDRYLGAVRMALIGHRRRDDIIDELREEIASQIEEREAALGRPLTDDELEALLKAHGHPLVVASRYRGRQYLIGPTMLPLYEVGVVAVLAFAALLQVIDVLASGDPLQALSGAVGGFINAALTLIGLLTVVAVALEHAQVRVGFLEDWRVRDLPDLRAVELPGASRPVKVRFGRGAPDRWERLMQVVFAGVLLLWWTGVVHWPAEWALQSGAMLHVGLAPAWDALYWLVVAFAALTLAGGVAGFVAPRDRLQFGFEAAACVVGLGVAAYVLRSGEVLAVRVTGGEPGAHGHLVHNIETVAGVMMIALGVIWLVELLRALWRLVQSRAVARPA